MEYREWQALPDHERLHAILELSPAQYQSKEPTRDPCELFVPIGEEHVC